MGAMKEIATIAWEHGIDPQNLISMRRHIMEDNTSWARGNLSLEHFAQEHRWAQVLDQQTTADLMRRWDRACQISKVNVTSRGHDYQVTSQTDPTMFYIVDLEKGCTCPDGSAGYENGQFRPSKAPFGWCKHRLAAWQWQKWFDQELEAHRASFEYQKSAPSRS